MPTATSEITTAPASPGSKTAPASAFLLTAAIGAATAFAVGDATSGGNVPVTIVALSGEPLSHWYWGRIVMDLAGMSVHKSRLPLDWCHDADQIVGYLDSLDTAGGNLTCKGALTPTSGGDDRAKKIIDQSGRGVPFEASIFWEPGRIDFLEAGFSATVNGRQIDGPCYIVSQWRLRGVAVCPWGVDPNTSTQFAGRSAERSITIHPRNPGTPTEGFAMPTAPANAPAATPAVKPETAPATPAAATPTQFAGTPGTPGTPATPATPSQAISPAPASAGEAPGRKFMDAFGEERGALYFAKGLSFEQAAAEHIKFQAQQIESLKQAPTAAATQTGANPVPFNAPAPENGKPSDATGGKTKFASCFRIAGKR